MNKFVVVALLGMLALAAAVDVEPQKKHYKGDDDGSYGGEHHDVPKSWIEAKSKSWTWEERVLKTFPCAEEYEIYGTNVVQTAELKEGGSKIGHVFWSGVVVKFEECGHCKEYKSKGHHHVKVNYVVTFEIEGKGTIVAEGLGDSIFSEETLTLAVIGGTGHYVGLTGTFTWTFGNPSKYEFEAFLPKIHKSKSYGGEEEKEYKY